MVSQFRESLLQYWNRHSASTDTGIFTTARKFQQLYCTHGDGTGVSTEVPRLFRILLAAECLITADTSACETFFDPSLPTRSSVST